MSLILVTIGVLLLLICVAGIVLGAYMASSPKTREPGALFALWWLSGAAGASGVIMRDGVTFLVGTLCFLVAGAVFLTFGSGRRAGRPPYAAYPGSEATTKENKSGHRQAAKSGYRRAAS